MKKNEGQIDRTIRVLAGTFIVSLAFWGPQTLWGYIGLIPLITGLVGVCPAYFLFGIDTCPLNRKSS